MARNNGMGGHGPSTSFERPKEGSGKVLRRLWSYLRHYRWLLFFAAVLSVTSNLLALVGRKLSGYAIDAIRPGAGGVDFETVFYYAGLMLVFYLLSSVLSYLLASILVRLARNSSSGPLDGPLNCPGPSGGCSRGRSNTCRSVRWPVRRTLAGRLLDKPARSRSSRRAA